MYASTLYIGVVDIESTDTVLEGGDDHRTPNKTRTIGGLEE